MFIIGSIITEKREDIQWEVMKNLSREESPNDEDWWELKNVKTGKKITCIPSPDETKTMVPPNEF